MLPNDRQGVVGGAARVLTGARLAQPQFGVLSTFPMNDQDDLTRRLIDIDDDLVDQGAHQLLAATHGDVGVLPGGLEILGDGPQVRHTGVGALAVVASRRASQSRTRRSAVSQFFSSVAAISRLSGSQAA